MAGTKAATLMSCGERAPVPHSEQTSKKASGCCQMSAPVPDQPRSALPDNSFGEFSKKLGLNCWIHQSRFPHQLWELCVIDGRF